MQTYTNFLESKEVKFISSGIDANLENTTLFQFQRDIVKRALKKGKYCIFAQTGLGKCLMALSWANELVEQLNIKVLFLAPLGVAKQTISEGEKFGINCKYAADNSQVTDEITVTNYERLDKFDCSQFDAVVLDESSCLKSYSSKTTNQIIETFQHTPYKLSCSATPSPNDFEELGNQCEFLNVMTREEMLAMYFVHDGGSTAKWRLKGHAQKEFWKFVSNWATVINHPRDFGYEQSGYDLPPINYHSYKVKTHIPSDKGELFAYEGRSLTEQRNIRKLSMSDRCNVAAEIVNNSHEQFVVWCETNDESKLLRKLIPDAVEVKGSDGDTHKEDSATKFTKNEIRVLITKPSIFGYGMNWQQCSNAVYVGLSHSFEKYYQSVRRLYRFGQSEIVDVHIIQHVLEGNIERNLKRKEDNAKQMFEQNIQQDDSFKRSQYKNQIIKLPDWIKTLET